MESCLSINFKKNEIIVSINENANQIDIIENFKRRLVKLKEICQEHGGIMHIGGKILKNKERQEVYALVKEYLDVDIVFDYPKELGLAQIDKTYNREIAISETKFHRGSVRSGQKVTYEGSIVIMGDVNDGAEIIAEGNIAVIGTLRGLAHAGAKGNKEAIISASRIVSPQLRIANIVKEIEKEEELNQTKKTYAYINKEEIIIE